MSSIVRLDLTFNWTDSERKSSISWWIDDQMNGSLSLSYWMTYESVRISHDLFSHKLFNRGFQILLNLRYVVEERIWWILTQAVLKNIESLRFYKYFTSILRKTQKMTKLANRGLSVAISRKWLGQLSWNFVRSYILVSPTYHKIFIPKC